MKRYRFLLLFLVLGYGYIGCNENEIALYQESARINFLSRATMYTFRDTDYVKNNTYHKLEAEVELQGYLLEGSKDFVIKTQVGKYEKQAEVKLSPKYTYTTLDTSRQLITFDVKRPVEPTKVNEPEGIILKFDLENPGHEFAPGRVDMDSCKVEVYYNLAPTSATWNATWWGAYSIGKYFFMMDYFKMVYKDMDRGKLAELKQVYEKYKLDNRPILDDEGVEITFPN